MKTLINMSLMALLLGAVVACDKPADVASRNLSTAADNFEIVRKISFYNSWNDVVMLQIEGRCALGPQTSKLTVTCRVGRDEYKKHYLGLGGNVTYIAEQLGAADVSTFHHRIMFRPQALIPDFDAQGDADELFKNRN